MSSLTVYGFTTLEGASQLSAVRPRVQGRLIRPVVAGGLAAVVGRTPRALTFDMGLSRKGRRRESHRRVLETLMVFMPILPAKEGTVVRDGARLRTILEACAPDLRDPVDHYGPLVQIDVRVSWSVVDAIAQMHQGDLIRRHMTPGGPRGNHAARVLKAAVDGQRRAQTERIRTILAGVALDVIETHPGQDDVVAQFTVLLRRADELSLDAVLDQLHRETGGHLEIQCLGPIPPCSFAAVELHETDYRAVADARRQLSVEEAVSKDDLQHAYQRAIRSLLPVRGMQKPAAEIDRIRDAYALLSRVADGQLKRRVTEPEKQAEPIRLDSGAVEDLYTVRLLRLDDGQAHAA